MGFVQVLWAAISTVLSTAGVIGMGAVLIRRGWVGPAAVKEWSKTVTGFLLPCFLFSNMSSTTLDQLQEGWVLPVFCVVHIMIGMLLGTVTSMLLRADWGPLGSPTTAGRCFAGGIIAMSGFGNASLGLSMMPAIIAGNPALGTKEHAAFCVTLYAVLNKVGIWSVAAELLSSCKLDEEKRLGQPSIVVKMLTEPVNVAAAAGLAVGLTPPLKALFVSGAPLGWAMNSCKTVGTACFPLMTLLLGCNLAQGTSSDRVDMPSVGVVTIVRLVVFPFVCLGVSRFCMVSRRGTVCRLLGANRLASVHCDTERPNARHLPSPPPPPHAGERLAAERPHDPVCDLARGLRAHCDDNGHGGARA